MRTKKSDKPDVLVFEESTKDYILLEDGNKLFFTGRPTAYNEDKSLYMGVVFNSKTGMKEFVKFVESKYRQDEEEQWKVTNLEREGAFQFYYPFIVYVYGCFEGTVTGHCDGEKTIEKKVFGVRVEYVDGFDLATHRAQLQKCIYKKKITWEEFEKVMFRQMLQILYGMRYYTEYAHRPYLTRDLKPKNVMVDRNGIVKIIDFDFAHISGSEGTVNMEKDRALARSDGFTDPRTVRYSTFDLKTEIYEAGKTLFYWLNGEFYFKEEEKNAYYDDKKLAYGNDITRYVERYQDKRFKQLRNILGKMYAEPNLRYNNVSEIIEDFKAFLLEYYGGEAEVEEALNWNQMSLLQSRKVGKTEKYVGYKICKPGCSVDAKPLAEYGMRPICVKKDDGSEMKIMTIYHLKGKIYYIPAMDVDLKRVEKREDFEIQDQDEFVAEDIRFKFIL